MNVLTAEVFDQLYSKIEAHAAKYPVPNFFCAAKEAPERRVVLYGAGGNCQFALYVCSPFSAMKISCICDSKLRGRYIYEHPDGGTSEYAIISPEQLIEGYRDALVCITTWKYEEEIRRFLMEQGFPAEQIFYLRSPWIMPPAVFREAYMDDYRRAYALFPDTRSKQKIIDRVRYHLLGEACPPDSLHKDGYFAYPGIRLEDKEVYVDGGAYIGDTAKEFIQAMNTAGKRGYKVYSFEPDSHNQEIARKTLAAYSGVELVPMGLWSRPATLMFRSDLDSNHIGSNFTSDPNQGSVSMLPVTSLDAFFKDKPENEWPTIIKTDIEGSEKEALLGAAEVIRRKKPRLMISAYHKPEDIYELPKTILSIRDDYQIRLWQIGESYWDMVLYAV